jgi:hypothetical protein
MADAININTQSVNVTLNVKAGATQTIDFIVEETVGVPLDITGWEAEMQVRAAVGAPTADITYTSSPAAGLTIDGVNGKITLVIDPADTNDIATFAGGRTMFWDLEIDSTAGIRYTPFEGCWILFPQITITE